MDMSGLSASEGGSPRGFGASHDESSASELDLRLKQVGDVLDAAQAMFAEDGGSVGAASQLRDIDAYLASKGIYPSPRGFSAGPSPANPGGVRAGVDDAAARVDVSRLPPDRSFSGSRASAASASRASVPRPASAPAPIPSTAAPDLRSNGDDSLSSLPFKFSMFGEDLASSGLRRSVGVAPAQPQAPPAPAPAPELPRKYHVLSVYGPAWRELSSRLRDVGAPPIVVNSSVGGGEEATVHEREVLESVHQLLWLVTARARETLDVAAAHHSDGDVRSQAHASASTARLQSALAAEEKRRREAEEKYAAAARELDARLKEFTRAVADSKAKVAHSEHRAKRRESELEDLRRRLAHNSSTQREAEVRASKLVSPGRDSHLGSPDAKSVDAVVSAFERQREDMNAELAFLRSECERLHGLVRERENTIASLRSGPGGGDRDRAAVHAAQTKYEEKLRRVQEREHQLNRDKDRWEATVESVRAQCAALTQELDTAKLELENRPTNKEYRDAMRRVRELERDLTSVVEPQQYSHGSRLGDRKQYGTSYLVATDKAVHKRLMRGMSTAGVGALSDTVREVCVELGVQHPESVGPAVRKLKRAVEAIPPMEVFIQRVTDAVATIRMERAGLEYPPTVRGETAMAPHTLDTCLSQIQAWARELRERDSFKRLRASLLVEVRSLLGPGGDGELGDEELLACIRRIVRSEQVSAKARSVYAAAEAELLAHGAEGVLPGIVSHFGKLFDVKRLEGMFPRINELYLYVNEMRNFMTVLKDLLELDPHVSTNTVLASVRESLSRSRGGTRRHTRLTPSVSSDDDDGVPVVVLGKARRQGEPPIVESVSSLRPSRGVRDRDHSPAGPSETSSEPSQWAEGGELPRS